MTKSAPDLLCLSTRQLEPIVRQYVNPDVARTVPELQRSIVKLLGHEDPKCRRTPGQVQRRYNLPRPLMLALIVAYTREREAERRQASNDALTAALWGRA